MLAEKHLYEIFPWKSRGARKFMRLAREARCSPVRTACCARLLDVRLVTRSLIVVVR